MTEPRFNIPKYDEKSFFDSLKKRSRAKFEKEREKDKRDTLMLILTVGLFIETLIIIVLTILLL